MPDLACLPGDSEVDNAEQSRSINSQMGPGLSGDKDEPEVSVVVHQSVTNLHTATGALALHVSSEQRVHEGLNAICLLHQ